MSTIEETPRTEGQMAPVPETANHSTPMHAEEHEHGKPSLLHKIADKIKGVHHSEHAHGEKPDPTKQTPDERMGNNLGAKQEFGLVDPHGAEGYGTGANLGAATGGLGATMPRSL